jgi:hypothetical protein
MLFIDQLQDRSKIPRYEATLADLADFVAACSRYLWDAFELTQQRTYPEQQYHHATIILLMRHLVEAVDGVGLLVAKGSAEPCEPLLRSGFEALTSILYILKEDTERRARAYQVRHVHRKIKLYRKFIPTDDVGRALRTDLKDDPFLKFFDNPGIDWQGKIDGLKEMLVRPEYAPIQAEWEQVKKTKKNPNWYSLFGGPNDLRTLCVKIGKGALYEILYREWSEFAHAVGAFDSISEGTGGRFEMQPIRVPKGIEEVCTIASDICVETVMTVVKKFASDELPKFEQRFSSEFRAKKMELLTTKVLKINWEEPPMPLK